MDAVRQRHAARRGDGQKLRPVQQRLVQELRAVAEKLAPLAPVAPGGGKAAQMRHKRIMPAGDGFHSLLLGQMHVI